MKQEKIIRSEAGSFFNDESLDRRYNGKPIDTFKVIKARLLDFYSSENKAIFLDEIQRLYVKDLADHRSEKHGGNPGKDCAYENFVEGLLFYIDQEVKSLPLIAHKRYQGEVSDKNKIFVSYSNVDSSWLEDIKRHFKPFSDKLNFWDDTKITPGTKWLEEIKKAIKETKVAIFLVTTDFLGSEFINRQEVPPLLEAAEKDGVTILIVIVKPCLFEEFDNLNIYQAVNPPSRPLSSMDDHEKEEVYVNLVRQAKKIMEL